MYKDFTEHGEWLYDKELLKDQETKAFEGKMIVLTKDADYFIDDEGAMWKHFMKFQNNANRNSWLTRHRNI